MTDRFLFIFLAFVLLVPAGASLLRAQETEVFERRYEVEFLDPLTAEAVAQNQCPADARSQDCRVGVVTGGSNPGGIIAVAADAETHERIAAALTERDVPPASQAFQVTLLRADRSGGGAPGELPEAVAQALEDVRPFLPYTGYEILDAGFLRTTVSGFVELSGPEGRVYEALLAFEGSPGAERELFVHRFRLEERSSGGSVSMPPPPEVPEGSATPSAPGSVAPRAPRTVLSTSFSITPGETVVVGTSRIGGGSSALVVLLTAIP
ncbi:MAG: hypothetical protein R3234_04590 [Thermoanaerobaculia bacterium]|nr:hypothetical protein [Thermoanaerobaculia bacterium]